MGLKIVLHRVWAVLKLVMYWRRGLGGRAVTVLQYWHMALTAVATVHIGNSVH